MLSTDPNRRIRRPNPAGRSRRPSSSTSVRRPHHRGSHQIWWTRTGVVDAIPLRRSSDRVGGMSMRSIVGVLVSAILVVGCAGSTPSAAPAASAPAAAASASGAGAFGGAVQFKYHGKAATTKVDAVADGSNVSGTAVTDIGDASDLGKGTHTVQLGCAAKAGDMWAVAGKTEKSSVEIGRAHV